MQLIDTSPAHIVNKDIDRQQQSSHVLLSWAVSLHISHSIDMATFTRRKTTHSETLCCVALKAYLDCVTITGTNVPQFSAHVCCGQPAGWIKMSRPRRPCVRWEPSSPTKKGGQSPRFPAHVSQTARWIKMPLGTDRGMASAQATLC